MDEMRFDPMTGQPISQQPQQSAGQGKVVGFDPMTGQPVYESAAAPQYNNSTVSYYQPEKKSNKGLIIGIIAAIAVLVAGGVVAAILLFAGSPKVKITKACQNTFENLAKGDNLLLTALDFTEFANTKEYVADAHVEYNDYWGDTTKADITINKDAKAMQIEGEVTSPELRDIPIDGVITLDDSTIKASTSLLDYVFVYDYTKNADGYLADQLSYSGMDLSEMNEYIQTMYDLAFNDKSSTEISKDLLSKIKDVYNEIDVEKIGKEEFEINGKDVKCAGYEMEISEKEIEDIIDVYFDFCEDNYGESLDTILEAAEGTSLDDLKEEMLDEIGDIEFTIRFYIYKNQLAAIQIEVDGDELSIEFQGGDYRAQNIMMKAGSNKITIENEKKKNSETFTVKADKQEVFSYEYDSKSGELEITTTDYWGDKQTIDGITIKNDGKKFEIEVEEMPTDEWSDSTVEFSFSIKAGGAEISDMRGKEFDIFNASESDLEDIYEDIMELVYSY